MSCNPQDLDYLKKLINQAPNLSPSHIYANEKKMKEVINVYRNRMGPVMDDVMLTLSNETDQSLKTFK